MPTLKLFSNEDGTPQSNSFIDTISSTISSTLKLNEYTPIVEGVRLELFREFTIAERRIRTNYIKMPKDIKSVKNVTLVFYCSTGNLIQYYLEAWKNLIFNKEGEYYNPMSYYKKNIELFFYGPGNVGTAIPPAAHFTLKGCFPVDQNQLQFSYSEAPKRITVTQTFSVDDIQIDQGLAKKSVLAELTTMTSPIALTDKLVSKLSGGVSQYTIEDTYK